MFTPDSKLGVVEKTGEIIYLEEGQLRIAANIDNIWKDFYDGRIDQPTRAQRMNEYINGLSEEDQRWLDGTVGTSRAGKIINWAMQIATGTLDRVRLEKYPDGTPPSVAKATRVQKSEIRKGRKKS